MKDLETALQKALLLEPDPLEAAKRVMRQQRKQKNARKPLQTKEVLNHLQEGRLSPFGRLMAEASIFSEATLRQVLGEKIGSFGKPVGFFDIHKKVLLFQVSHPALAHEAHFYKEEIMTKLKVLPGFSQIQNIRFCVR